MLRRVMGWGLPVWLVALALGCADNKPAAVPTNLNQPLPPPPTAGGAKGKVAPPKSPTNRAD
jgi:hypothetical protein